MVTSFSSMPRSLETKVAPVVMAAVALVPASVRVAAQVVLAAHGLIRLGIVLIKKASMVIPAKVGRVLLLWAIFMLASI